jgi:hypothetical protein
MSNSSAYSPIVSVSVPGMSIAISSLYSAWSMSKTSSVNPWSAPSGITASFTGRSTLESHVAASRFPWMCSRFFSMSLRSSAPQTVGWRPTAMYLSIRAMLYREKS